MSNKKTLFVVDSPNINFNQLKCDYILNLTSDHSNDPRLLKEAELYQNTLHETRIDYIEFLHNYSASTNLIKRPFWGNSIWWFTEIQVKDSLWTTFFGDLVTCVFINNLKTKYEIDSIEVLSENNFLNSVFNKYKDHSKNYALKMFLSRVKLHFIYMRNFFLPESCPQDINTLFLSFLPQTFFKTNAKYKERIWGNWIKELPESALAVHLSETNSEHIKDIESNYAIIQKNIPLIKATISFFNLSHLLWYLFNKNKILKGASFKGINLSNVFNRFLLKSFIYNDLYYTHLISGLEGIVKKHNVKNIVCTGEFGLEAKAVSIVSFRSQIKSIWYQHSLFSTSKLWLQNSPKDMGQLPLPNELWVWSPFWTDFLNKESHFPKSRIRVIECYKQLKKNDYHQFPPTETARNFLFSPTLSQTEIAYFALIINELIQRKILTKDQVILKLHPAAAKNFDIPSILKAHHIEDIEVDNAPYNPLELSKKVKCIISGGTIVGLESAFLGFPVIQYVPMYSLNWGAFEKNDVPSFSDINELSLLIKEFDKLKKIDCLGYFFPANDENISFVENIKKLN